MAQRERLSLRTIRKRRGRDLFIILVSLYFASVLAQSGAVAIWLESAMGNIVLASFFAGLLFTSLFTIAPAIVTIIELLGEAGFPLVATFVAMGSVVGDLLLFLFVRDAVAEDLRYLVKGSWRRKFLAQARHPYLQWIVPFVGALIIASPLPDEIGLTMMGLSKMRVAILIPISFAMNFLGVALIWFGMQAW